MPITSWKSGAISPVLTFDPPQSGISTIRALKHAIHCLEHAHLKLNLQADADDVQIAIDDLELMLARAEGKK